MLVWDTNEFLEHSYFHGNAPLRPFRVIFKSSVSFSVSHGIDDDIDAKRVSTLFGVLLKVPLIDSFTFPAITQVRVVANDCHHAIVVVEDAFVMCFARVSTFCPTAAQCMSYARNDWLFFQVHHAIVGDSPHMELMVIKDGQFNGHDAGELYVVNNANYPDW